MKCPDCRDNMEFNKEENKIGEGISIGKADNILSRKLARAITGAALVSFIGLAVLFAKEFGNNNSINNGPKANVTHTEAELDYNINNDDLSENIVLKEIDEGDVIVTVALPEGYEPIKIDDKYYGEKITKVTEVGEIIYGLTADKLDQYNVIDKKGVNKDNPEDTISLIANTAPSTEIIYGLSADELEQYNIIDKIGVNKTNPEDTISLRAYTGRYDTKITTRRVPATVVRTTTINRPYVKK